MVRHLEIFPYELLHQDAAARVVVEDQGAVGALSVGNAAQVETLVALQERVALHNLEVEVGQGLGASLVDDERQPEAEARNLYGAGLDVHSVDVLLDYVALDGGGVCRHALQCRAAEENLAEHPHGERPRPNGGVAHLDVPQTRDEPRRNGGHARPVVRADEEADCLPHVVVALVVVLQVGREGLAAHILDNLLGSVIRPLVLVVLQQVLEDPAEHLGVYADLGVVGVVLVDGEIVLRQHREHASEILGGEAARFLVLRIALEKSAVEVWNPHVAESGDTGVERVRHVGAVGVEGLEERFEHGVEEVGLLPVCGLLEQAQHELPVALAPLVAGRHAQPPFLLQEVEEDDAPHHPLHVVADGLLVAVGFDKGLPHAVGRVGHVGHELVILPLIFPEELFREGLDAERLLDVGDGEAPALRIEPHEVVRRRAARLPRPEQESEPPAVGAVAHGLVLVAKGEPPVPPRLVGIVEEHESARIDVHHGADEPLAAHPVALHQDAVAHRDVEDLQRHAAQEKLPDNFDAPDTRRVGHLSPLRERVEHLCHISVVEDNLFAIPDKDGEDYLVAERLCPLVSLAQIFF